MIKEDKWVNKCILVVVVIFQILFQWSVGYAYSPKYPGFVIENENATPELLDQLRRHITKCHSDSKSFRKLLSDVEKRTAGIKKKMSLQPVIDLEGPIGFQVPGTPGMVYIEINDLRILPDPLRTESNADGFKPIPDIPPWATTVCSWLGHEIAEGLEDLLAGKQDWKKHHPTGLSIETKIIQDYFGVVRSRGEDCWLKHGNHNDTLFAIIVDGQSHLEHFHMEDDQVRPPNLEDWIEWKPTRRPNTRFALVEYRMNTQYPGKQQSSNECKPLLEKKIISGGNP